MIIYKDMYFDLLVLKHDKINKNAFLFDAEKFYAFVISKIKEIVLFSEINVKNNYFKGVAKYFSFIIR